MNLKFACSDQFESAEDIAKGIQGYLPNLIQNVDIVRTEAFVGIFEVWDARLKVERIIEPDFFHSKAWGQAWTEQSERHTVEDGRMDFCPKCRQLMLQLEDPLDFDDISARVEEIYRLKPKPGAGTLRRFFLTLFRRVGLYGVDGVVRDLE